MNKRKAYGASCEVSEIVRVKLGGYEQKIAIEGKKKNAPVIVVLHGGPGSPVPFSVGLRGFYTDYTDQAVMVYWDQLGCGCNNFPLSEDFTSKNYTEMTCDLVDYLHARFPENKIYLFGTSWGSVHALGAANRDAEKIAGVIVWGQIIKELIFNKYTLGALGGVPGKVRREVDEIVAEGKNSPEITQNIRRIMKIVDRYTDGRTSHKAENIAVKPIIKALLKSHDYSFKDFRAVVKNGFHKNTSIWHELLEFDLADGLKTVGTPYLIIQGEDDLITPPAPVVEAVKSCGNPLVELKLLKGTGHIPTKAAFNAIYEEIFNFITKAINEKDNSGLVVAAD